jgi:hypothetical protein
MATEAARRILQTAAPGQFEVVAENVQKLGKDTLKGNWLEDIKLVQQTNQCIGINKVTNHPLSDSLREKLKAYQAKTYNGSNVTSRVALTLGETSNELIVHTYAEKIDIPNQYTGAWRSTWTIKADSGDSAEISGVVKLHTFSYEDGNIHLRTGRDFDAVTVDKPAEQGVEVSAEGGLEEAPSLAQALVEKIIAWEHEVLSLLSAMREGRIEEKLRSLRRILPITKTRMKWDVVAHRNVKTLRVTAK